MLYKAPVLKDKTISEKQPKYLSGISSLYAHHESRITASMEEKNLMPYQFALLL